MKCEDCKKDMEVESELPKCPVCGTQLEWYHPGGLFRFKCPKGWDEIQNGGYLKHGLWM